jgi:plastocyanin
MYRGVIHHLARRNNVKSGKALIAALALGLVAAACGGDSGTTEDTSAPTTAATTTTAAAATTAAPETTAADMDDTGDAVEFTIVADANSFDLEEVRVHVGDTVRIILDNRDTGTDEPHNIHFRTGDGDFFTTIEEAPVVQELEFTVTTAGEFEFFCDTHLDLMSGAFIVEEDM